MFENLARLAEIVSAAGVITSLIYVGCVESGIIPRKPHPEARPWGAFRIHGDDAADRPGHSGRGE